MDGAYASRPSGGTPQGHTPYPLLAHECRCSRTFKGSVSPSALSTAPPYLVEAFCSGPLPHHVGRLVGASLEPRWTLAGASLDPRWSLAGPSLGASRERWSPVARGVGMAARVRRPRRAPCHGGASPQVREPNEPPAEPPREI
jgi:hypothetical protein